MPDSPRRCAVCHAPLGAHSARRGITRCRACASRARAREQPPPDNRDAAHQQAAGRARAAQRAKEATLRREEPGTP